MIFNSKNTVNKEGFFTIDKKVKATAHSVLCNETVIDFWHSFCFNLSSLETVETNELIFKIGSAEALPLEGNEYSINITPKGVCVAGENEQGLMHGFLTLIDRMVSESDKVVKLNCCEIKESPLVKNRMVHYCIFPDTELWEFEKFVRFCCALKYSHIVVEFWGMLRYDCMRELYWDHAFTKEQIAPIIQQANDLGVEIIPMFNHFGHAAACRIMHGKHVVLDRAPELQYLFSPDGWCWNIKNSDVRELLAKIRRELCELCGNGKWFHIGLDEPFNFQFTEENTQMVCDFINEINRDIKSLGRRTIVWADMFLYYNPEYNKKNQYTANCPDEKTQNYMLAHLDKDILMGDWQYDCAHAPVETSAVFTNAGFECIICPWDRGTYKADACIDTLKAQNLFGVMHTTWHTLSWGTPHVVRIALQCWGWEHDPTGRDYIENVAGAAEIMRKAYRVNGDYTKAGWAKYEVGVYVG